MKFCLGIESTAHTYGVGIIDFDGNVLSTVNDTYVPESGGLHPRMVVEHHNSVFMKVIQKALDQAKITLRDINLIAFSQGPGLGPCLRIGAGSARTLAQKLKIPLIGVNHCISHVEIGRRISGAIDPITLYVSGGNTIVSAFETGKYRVFGETLDLAVGNMIDMVARDLGLPHPGGPKIEKLAREGTKYLPLPYIVKGMDLSFSGLYTKCRNLIKSKDFGVKYTANDIAYSLQETAFAMLAEVTERAIAHTEKKEVLLTGGVAANKRLQEMIKYISDEHGAEFHVVPLRLAGDNGAMIGWTGILHYLNKGGMEINSTIIDPKWRMDEVYIPWRFEDAKYTGMEIHTNKTTPKLNNSNGFDRNIEELIKNNKTEIIRKGAEAALIRTSYQNNDVLIKYRLPKKYRLPEIDKKIRSQRTANEARILIRAKRFGVPTPIVHNIDLENSSIYISYIKGERLKDAVTRLNSEDLKQKFKKVGAYVGRLHKNNQIHGDLTTSNIMLMDNDNMFFIDFGLGFNSTTNEDKAVDLHLFKRTVTSTHGEYFNDLFPPFVEGYIEEYGEGSKRIIAEIEDIELRGRYIKKDKRKRGIIKKT